MEFKLKHLDIISAKQVDYSTLMKDVGEVNRWRSWKVFKFIETSKQLYHEVDIIRQMDVSKVRESEHCNIKRPNDIDIIPLSAMIELQMLFSNGSNSERPVGELIADMISIACFCANNAGDFDSDSEQFKTFKHQVQNSELIAMLGLYQWIDKAINKSSDIWDRRFKECEIIDKDYEQAGGSRMNQFSLILTIRNTCTDFCVTYQQALQMPYGITQANSLAKATQSHIQQIMTDIIEARMRSDRKSH